MPWGSDPIIGQAPAPKASGGSGVGALRTQQQMAQDEAKRLADEQKAQRSRTALKYNAGYVLHQAGRAMTESGKDWVKNPITRFFNENTGVHGNALMAAMPWTHAGQLRETIEPIRARLAFDTLNQMRLDSPNGASLGNITDNDMKLLAASAGSLNVGQPEERLDRTLIDIRKRYVHLLKLWGYTDQDINEATANQEPSPAEVTASASRPAPASAGAPGRGPAPSAGQPGRGIGLDKTREAMRRKN